MEEPPSDFLSISLFFLVLLLLTILLLQRRKSITNIAVIAIITIGLPILFGFMYKIAFFTAFISTIDIGTAVIFHEYSQYNWYLIAIGFIFLNISYTNDRPLYAMNILYYAILFSLLLLAIGALFNSPFHTLVVIMLAGWCGGYFIGMMKPATKIKENLYLYCVENPTDSLCALLPNTLAEYCAINPVDHICSWGK